MNTQYRPYNKDRDKEAAHRIWREVGWLEKGQEEILDLIIGAGTALVADIGGSPEALVLSAPGTMRCLDDELSFAGVTGVACSRIARKRGLARKLTARLVAQAAEDGAATIGLGMFEQGFYDHLGFGSGCYDHWVSFDPAQLTVDIAPRLPLRLSQDDWMQMHACRLARRRGHGNVNLFSPELTLTDLKYAKDGFGFGYRDKDGHLTHYFWANAKGEHGPYEVYGMAYQTGEQFLELMALLRNLGDQVHSIRMAEPQGIQMQDLLRQPFRWQHMTEKGRFETFVKGEAWWQVRICDLQACLAVTHLASAYVRFNLQLSDPIKDYLGSDTTWRGVSGDYVVTLGPDSQAEPGGDADLPTMRTTINAFSRLWLGIRPATGLAVTDSVRAPAGLLADLDRVLRLPQPSFGWGF